MTVCANCGFEEPSGCTCGFLDTESVAWMGAGVAANPLIPAIPLDPDDTNQLTDLSGLYAGAPSRFVTVPRVRLRKSTAQSIGAGAAAYITMDTEVYDTDGTHSGSDNFITIRTRGLYRIGSCVQWQASANTPSRKMFISKNNDEQLVGMVDPAAQDGGVTLQWCRATAALEIGDVLQLAVINETVGALNIEAVDELSPILWATFHRDLPNRRLAS